MKRVFVFGVVFMLGLVGVASAQQDLDAITWLAYEKTESGKSRELIGASIKDDGPMYDEMLKNGTLSSWGIAIPINHHLSDDWNYMLWATMAGWGDVQKLQGGFQQMFSTRTPEQMMENQKVYDEATVDGAHHDAIIRHHAGHLGSPDGEVAPKYFHISYWKVAPEGFDGMIGFFKDNVAPILAKHHADGSIASYGISTQELHGDSSWTHVSWYTVSELAAIDAVGKSLDEGLADVDMGPIMSAMDWDSHRDQVLVIVHLGGMSEE